MLLSKINIVIFQVNKYGGDRYHYKQLNISRTSQCKRHRFQRFRVICTDITAEINPEKTDSTFHSTRLVFLGDVKCMGQSNELKNIQLLDSGLLLYAHAQIQKCRLKKGVERIQYESTSAKRIEMRWMMTERRLTLNQTFEC